MFTVTLDDFKKKFLSYSFDTVIKDEHIIPCYLLKDFKDRWGDKQELVSRLYGYVKVKMIDESIMQVEQLN